MLVRLEAEPPPRIRETEPEGFASVLVAVRAIQWLQEEVLEVQRLEGLRVDPDLWVHDLELAPRTNLELASELGAHADPVDTAGDWKRAIGLDGDLEIPRVELIDERGVELEQRFSARADNEPRAASLPPGPRRLVGKLRWAGEAPPALPVHSNEVGVAPPGAAPGAQLAVRSSTGPQVAPSKAQEDSRPARVHALSLKRVDDLFDRISHGVYAAGRTGSMRPSSRKPFSLK